MLPIPKARPSALALAAWLCAALVAVSTLVATAVALAQADAPTGGTVAPEPPEVAQVRCDTGDTEKCARGEVLHVVGENLAATRAVVFLGGRGRRDDRRARASQATPESVLVRVPRRARSGAIRIVSSYKGGSVTGPRLKVLNRPPAPAVSAQPVASPADAGGVFPVQGRHEYGTETNRFGGGRGHQGHDVFAACGTRLVAALAGKVTLVRYHSAAGNYVVIKADDGTSQAYMHLQEAATVRKGQRVEAGTPIGRVGATGRASGCHLHFELWTAPGWYEGGEPIDPLPLLKRLDQGSKAQSARAARSRPGAQSARNARRRA